MKKGFITSGPGLVYFTGQTFALDYVVVKAHKGLIHSESNGNLLIIFCQLQLRRYARA